MITDEQQDNAALYVLDQLEEAEVSAFETGLLESAELRELVSELREAAGDLAFVAPAVQPPIALKARVMGSIKAERRANISLPAESTATRSLGWIPWAIAALLFIGAGMLAVDRARLQRDLVTARERDPLAETTLVALAPAAPAPLDAKASVAWESNSQSGVIQISNLPAAGLGKDYQLWIVDADHADPLSAGILHVDAKGVAQVRFKANVAARRVKAFAVSVEREGGVPKKEGPIILIGTV